MIRKIALIADIHGNLPAFNAVIEDIHRQNIDHIIIAGDMITDCPDSNEILNRIRAMNGTVIKGNREQYYLDHCAGFKNHWNDSKQMSSLIWSFSRLSTENSLYIRGLKDQLVLEIYGVKLRIVHGSPDSISELIYPIEKKARFHEIIHSLKEDILICGHSHQQWHCRAGGKLVVNPGSAGVHFNESSGAEYSILEFHESQIEVSQKQILYNIDELEKRFIHSGLYKESPLWSESILESLRQGQNVSMQLLDYAYDLMEKQGIRNSPTIPDLIWDQAGERYKGKN
jgi:putative phosphoesterase